MPARIFETIEAQKRLGQLIDMYSGRSGKMISEFINGRKRALALNRDRNFIGVNEYEVIDGIRRDYQFIVIYIGAESVRICYVVEPDRLVIFWYWRSNDPLSDSRVAVALAVSRD